MFPVTESIQPIESIVCSSAVVNHTTKTITFTSPTGETVDAKFEDYDEWGSEEFSDGTHFNFHILEDDGLNVFAYGNERHEDGKVLMDTSNDIQLEISEVGEPPY